MEKEITLGNMSISFIEHDIKHTIKQHKIKPLINYLTTLSKVAVKDENATLQMKYDFVMGIIGIERLDHILHDSAIIYKGCYQYQTPDEAEQKVMEAMLNLFLNLGITVDEFGKIGTMFDDAIDLNMYPLEKWEDHCYKPHSTYEVLVTLRELMEVMVGDISREKWVEYLKDPYFNNLYCD